MACKAAICAIFVIATATSAMALGPRLKPRPKHCGAWQDSFSDGYLDASRWSIANGSAPGYIPNQHAGFFEPHNVSLANSLLSIAVTQVKGSVDANPNGVVSYGGMVYTNEACAYGTYSVTMRMSSEAFCSTCVGSAISGAVSAGFLFANNSQTEIDFEFSPTTSNAVWVANWLNTDPTHDPTAAMVTSTEIFSAARPSNGFHTYKLVWAATSVSFYLDGALVSVHTTNIPSAPAHFMITHWGTNGPWGGPATLGITRYFYVKNVSFTPAPMWR